jgi:hypothetical protein
MELITLFKGYLSPKLLIFCEGAESCQLDLGQIEDSDTEWAADIPINIFDKLNYEIVISAPKE